MVEDAAMKRVMLLGIIVALVALGVALHQTAEPQPTWVVLQSAGRPSYQILSQGLTPAGWPQAAPDTPLVANDTLLITLGPGSVRLLDAATGRLVREIPVPLLPSSSLDGLVSPSQRYLTLFCMNLGGDRVVVDLETNRSWRIPLKFDQEVELVETEPPLLIEKTPSEDDPNRFRYHTPTGERLPPGYTFPHTFSHGGRTVLWYDGLELVWYDMLAQRERSRWLWPGLESTKLHPLYPYASVETLIGEVWILDLRTGELVLGEPANGRRLYSQFDDQGRAWIFYDRDNVTRIHDGQDGHQITTLEGRWCPESIDTIIESTPESLIAQDCQTGERLWVLIHFKEAEPLRKVNFPNWPSVSASGRWVSWWETVDNEIQYRLWDREHDRTLYQSPTLSHWVSSLGVCEQSGMLWVNERPREAEWIGPWWQDWLPEALHFHTGHWSSPALVRGLDLETRQERFRLMRGRPTSYTPSRDGRFLIAEGEYEEGFLARYGLDGPKPWARIVGVPLGLGVVLFGLGIIWRRVVPAARPADPS
jgi:hypothetical protein